MTKPPLAVREISAWLFAPLLLLPAGCSGTASPPAQATTFRGQAMGTTWQVTVYPPVSSELAWRLPARLAGRLEELEDQMSPWREDSVISQFNRRRDTSPLEIPRQMAGVIAEALEIHELSGGAFDITAAPLVNRWGFGPPGRQQALPASEEIEGLLVRVGSGFLDLQEQEGTWWLAKTNPEVEIDLSAIAKGQAVDDMAALLEAAGCRNFLIEFGGEIRCRGVNAAGQAWRVGLENPDTASAAPLHATLELADASLATSGCYHNFVPDPAGGASLCHVIDPRTGRPIASELAAVSVVEKRCARADAWATALLVLGPEAGWQLAREQGLAVCLVTRTPEGFERRATPAFERTLVPP